MAKSCVQKVFLPNSTRCLTPFSLCRIHGGNRGQSETSDLGYFHFPSHFTSLQWDNNEFKSTPRSAWKILGDGVAAITGDLCNNGAVALQCETPGRRNYTIIASCTHLAQLDYLGLTPVKDQDKKQSTTDRPWYFKQDPVIFIRAETKHVCFTKLSWSLVAPQVFINKTVEFCSASMSSGC